MFTLNISNQFVQNYEKPIFGYDLAKDYAEHSKEKPSKYIAMEVDGELWDITRELNKDANIKFITKEDPQGLEIIRHDAAHVLAQAIKRLYPAVQITIGPVIENGFYYDIFSEKPFSTEMLETLEKEMQKIVKEDLPIKREVWNRNDAIKFFKEQGEMFKAEIISDLPEDSIITLYRQGDFVDLCRGPHLSKTGILGNAFKLMKVAGAYWRGDAKNPMLQRIYGTAWATKEELESYLKMLEEAEKRDHRKVGQSMELFHLQEEARGAVFWHPKGWTVYRLLEQFVRSKMLKNGYQEVRTPIIIDRKLWEDSGHWEKFRENMFVTELDDQVMAVKPMNCPAHVQIFKQGIKSYRDLPLRMSEFGCCHRAEPSGALHGLMRVRSFVQDDAHIFCDPKDIKEETIKFCALLKEIYADLGFNDIKIKFSDRPVKRAGSNEIWDKAESALAEAAKSAGLEYTLNPGEGAFYGPKLEFVLRDAIGRDWQCGTLQVDFVLPERLGAQYVAEDGNKYHPVMLHRAILGSMERFIGILIENYAGKFPLWLAPVQMVVASITDESKEYASKIFRELENKGYRVEIDLRNEKINYKIREHSLKKVPIMVVVGKKEAEEGTVSLRILGKEEQQVMTLNEAYNYFESACQMPGSN